MENKYHKNEIMMLRIANVFAVIIFSSISIGSIVYMFTRGDVFYYFLILVVALTAMLVFVYFTEFFFIRSSTVKEVLFKENKILFIFRSGRSVDVDIRSIQNVKEINGVHYYYTNGNQYFNRFHDKGKFSSTLFDDEINNAILSKVNGEKKIEVT